jgi:tetratricopeptide (TPR) repeat protein
MPAATIGMALMTQGHMGKARQYLADALEPLRQTGNDYEEHRAQAYLGTVLVATGRYPDGLRELHQAEAWARDNNHSLLVCITQILRALAHRSAMDWTAMLDCIAGVGDAALLQGEKLYAIFGWSLEAWALIHLGQSAKAAELRGKAKVLDKELGGKHAISHWFLAADGEAALLSGNPELTQSIAKSLVEVSAAATWPKSWGIAERLWGAALGQLGAPMEEIDVHMQESLRVLALGDLTLDAAQTELCWGQILRARGLHTQAAPHLDKARSAFAAAGCDHVLPGLHHTDRRAW